MESLVPNAAGQTGCRMIEPTSRIKCPCCGAEIELEARRVQGELPLGPLPLKNRLDRNADAGATIESVSDSPAHRARVPESNRQRTASCEGEDVIESIRSIVGEQEWSLNQKLWRWRVTNARRAIQYTLEDWKLQAPSQRTQIRNRAAWLTDRFKRALAEISREEGKGVKAK